jgi:hypothetical protein
MYQNDSSSNTTGGSSVSSPRTIGQYPQQSYNSRTARGSRIDVVETSSDDHFNNNPSLAARGITKYRNHHNFTPPWKLSEDEIVDSSQHYHNNHHNHDHDQHLNHQQHNYGNYRRARSFRTLSPIDYSVHRSQSSRVLLSTTTTTAAASSRQQMEFIDDDEYHSSSTGGRRRRYDDNRVVKDCRNFSKLENIEAGNVLRQGRRVSSSSSSSSSPLQQHHFDEELITRQMQLKSHAQQVQSDNDAKFALQLMLHEQEKERQRLDAIKQNEEKSLYALLQQEANEKEQTLVNDEMYAYELQRKYECEKESTGTGGCNHNHHRRCLCPTTEQNDADLARLLVVEEEMFKCRINNNTGGVVDSMEQKSDAEIARIIWEEELATSQTSEGNGQLLLQLSKRRARMDEKTSYCPST